MGTAIAFCTPELAACDRASSQLRHEEDGQMRIAQVAPPFESIPPVRYGGTERVVSTLTEELVRRGHDVTLFASGDSKTAARLVPVVDGALWHANPPYQDLVAFSAAALGKVAREMSDFDVVHNHLDYLAYPLARLAPCPVVTTLHGRLDLPELAHVYREFAEVPLVSISDAQRQPAAWANWVDTIYHGIPLDDFTFNSRHRGYLAFLGRISPEKGLDTAIRVARRAGMPLRIGARKPLRLKGDPNVEADWRHYHNDVKPLLERGHARLVGEVAGPDKDRFLRNAAALLFPIHWREPFGLVMAEALACGTPVIALRNGSVPEVIDDGVTGFICSNEEEMVAAVGRLGELDRGRCRAEAERRFSPAAMAEAYETVYQRLTDGTRPAGSPKNGKAEVRRSTHRARR
jgi:glycosyltransferase involved in cell wall biosynthesis